MTEYKLESKENFHNKIERYYLNLAGNHIPSDLLIGLVDKVTDTQYDNYKRFWNQYPKSRKRYSELRMDDLEYPFIQYMITDFLKYSDPLNYQKFSKILLRMNDAEFSDYEKRKYQYETK